MAPRLNIPPLTRGLLVAFVAFTALNAAARYKLWAVDRTANLGDRQYYAPYLTIVPGSSIIYPWVFATASFAESNPFGLLITGITLFYGGRYLERAWSSTEYFKFIVLVTVLPNIFTFISYVSLYAVTKNTGLITTTINGGISVQAAFLVAFKQLVPEHTVSLAKGLIRVRVKHFPAVFLLANTISGFTLGTDTAALLAWFGFLTSWTYLRFYRTSPSLVTASTGEASSTRGDASDTFAFSCFFPDVAQPPIQKVADAVYEALVAIKVCAPFSAEDVDIGNEQAMARGESGLPSLLHSSGGGKSNRGGRREEAERRRALALRALDQRLHAATVKQPSVAQAASLGETSYEPEHDRPRSSQSANASSAQQS